MEMLIPISFAAALAGCTFGEEALPSGCYRAEDGTPILRLEGTEAEMLIPGEVQRAHVRKAYSWRGRKVEVRPSFHVRGYYESVLNPGPVWRSAVGDERVPAILLPIEAFGEMPVRLGRAC